MDAVKGESVTWLHRMARGEYGLGGTYWLGWGLGGGISATPLILLMVAAHAIDSAVAMALAWVCGVAIYGGYNALAIIGVWRAADAYAGWRGWAIWAKVNVASGCIGLAVLALSVVLVPLSML